MTSVAVAAGQDGFLTPDEVVALLRLRNREALYAMRSRGVGPPATHVGRKLLFRRSEFWEWCDQQRAGQVRDSDAFAPDE